MYAHTDNPSVQNRLRSSIHESERNINYLTDRLKELELKARSAQRASVGQAPVPPPKDVRPTENGRGFDRGGWQPASSAKTRQYTKLGTGPPPAC
jgi:hypothetical protein